MGLDMYLFKNHYIGANYAHRNVSAMVDIKIGDKQVPINPHRISTIKEQVAYWRKHNHIHRWFVENVQDGEDDCLEYDVSTEQLMELVGACKQALQNRGEAENILPTQQGFFFGGTDYDDFYFGSLEETATILEKLLAEDGAEEADYIYTSSW